MNMNQDKQRGFTTLAISLILLVVLTMMTLYSAQVGVLKQRIAGNEVRERDARVRADALIESGLQFTFANRRHLRSEVAGSGWMAAGAERWTPCAGADLPCGNGTDVVYDGNSVFYSFSDRDITQVSTDNSQLHLVATAGPAGGPRPDAVYTLVAVSPADDGTGESIVRQAFWLRPLLSGTPDAPLIVAGGVALGGNFNLAANPNGGGPGVPLSVWTDADVQGGGAYATCHIEEYDRDGKCDTNADTGQLSQKGNEGLDILDVDGNQGVNPDSPYFPDDMFEYVFGVPAVNWQEFKANNVPADHQLNGCGTLNAQSSGIYWIDGDCDIKTQIGTTEAPVILVVQEADLTMNASAHVFGLIFSFDAPGNAAGPGSIKINGTATMNGSFMANHPVDLAVGTFNARYDSAVLENLANADENKGVGKVPGSWADYF
jgi:Tfp pilus assembly protein PilX